MNTVSSVPFLKPDRDYVFCNEDLELAFEKHDLDIITDKWNRGHDILQIAEEHKRDPDEIFLAIFHQARKGKITRKISAKNPEVVYVKMKRGIPSVIEYAGRRYVYDPGTVRRSKSG